MLEPCIMVHTGEICIADKGTLFCPGIGSCIVLALRARKTGRVAMAHIFLPDSPDKTKFQNMPGKYADTAIDKMTGMLLPDGGDESIQLEAFLAGGAQMFPFRQTSTMMDIGRMNIEKVLSILLKKRIPIIICEVGGNTARTVQFDINSSTMFIVTKFSTAKHISL